MKLFKTIFNVADKQTHIIRESVEYEKLKCSVNEKEYEN